MIPGSHFDLSSKKERDLIANVMEPRKLHDILNCISIVMNNFSFLLL